MTDSSNNMNNWLTPMSSNCPREGLLQGQRWRNRCWKCRQISNKVFASQNVSDPSWMPSLLDTTFAGLSSKSTASYVCVHDIVDSREVHLIHLLTCWHSHSSIHWRYCQCPPGTGWTLKMMYKRKFSEFLFHLIFVEHLLVYIYIFNNPTNFSDSKFSEFFREIDYLGRFWLSCVLDRTWLSLRLQLEKTKYNIIHWILMLISDYIMIQLHRTDSDY